MQFGPGIQVEQEPDVIAFLKRLFDAPAEQTEPQVDDDGTQGRSTVIWGTLSARRKVVGMVPSGAVLAHRHDIIRIWCAVSG